MNEWTIASTRFWSKKGSPCAVTICLQETKGVVVLIDENVQNKLMWWVLEEQKDLFQGHWHCHALWLKEWIGTWLHPQFAGYYIWYDVEKVGPLPKAAWGLVLDVKDNLRMVQVQTFTGLRSTHRSYWRKSTWSTRPWDSAVFHLQ